MYRIVIWTVLGALTGLAFAILGIASPSFPSRFWDAFYQIEPAATKPAIFAYRCWVQWIPLPNGQYFSFFRFFVVNIIQWLLLGFLVGVSAHFSKRHSKKAREEQFKKNYDNAT